MKHKRRRRGEKRNFFRNNILLLMILPAVIYFLVFAYVPMSGIVVAFKEFSYSKGIFGSEWVGFDNFEFFFRSGDAWHVTKNTVLYNLVFISLGTVLQITAAIFLSEMIGRRSKKTLQSMMFLPYFISWVVVGAFIYNIFNYEHGWLNQILMFFGREPINMYIRPELWKYVIVFFKMWKDIGYGSVLYLAALTSIDPGMYEAAEIEGANMFQKIRHITLPSLKPTMIVLILLSVSNIFRGDFQMFYNITGNNGILYDATDVIDTYVFRSLIQIQEFGMSAAAGLYQSLLCFVFIIVINKAVKMANEDYALF